MKKFVRDMEARYQEAEAARKRRDDGEMLANAAVLISMVEDKTIRDDLKNIADEMMKLGLKLNPQPALGMVFTIRSDQERIMMAQYLIQTALGKDHPSAKSLTPYWLF